MPYGGYGYPTRHAQLWGLNFISIQQNITVPATQGYGTSGRAWDKPSITSLSKPNVEESPRPMQMHVLGMLWI